MRPGPNHPRAEECRMAHAIGTNVCIVSWVIDCETVGGFGLTCTLYPVHAKKCGGGTV